MIKGNTLEDFKRTSIQATRVDPATGGTDNSAYFGDKDLERWGVVMITSRDAEVLERSNWQVVTEDLQERFPEATDIEEWGHWAVGWIKKLYVDTHDEAAIQAAFEWREKLDGYPVADEEHYSQLEEGEVQEAYDSYGKDDVIRWLRENDDPLELLDENGEPLEAREQYLYRLFRGCHEYNNEYFVHDEAMNHAMGEVEYEIAHEERARFEQVQPPLPGADERTS